MRLAVLLLPPSHRDRFRAEWSAELAAISGDPAASTRYGLGLVGAAVQMNKSIRADSVSGYLELSMASMSALVPTTVLAGWAISTQMWSMLVVQLLIAVGIVLVSVGLWTADGRLLDSIGSRVGLALVLGASIASTLVLGSDGVELLADQRVPVTLPNLLILLGLGILMASNYAGRHRGKVQLAALYVLAPGAFLLVVAAVVNAVSAMGMRWVIELVFALPAFVLAWACDTIARRPRVFDEAPLGST